MGLLNAKSYAIRLYFDSEQHTKLKQWIGVARSVYNHTIWVYNQNKIKPPKSQIRKWWKFEGDNGKTYMNDCPYNLKDGALEEALAAIEGGLSRMDDGKKKGVIEFRQRKDARQVLKINSQNISTKTLRVFPNLLFQRGKDYTSYLPRIRNKSNVIHPFKESQTLSTSFLIYQKRLREYTLHVNYTEPVKVHDKALENQESLKQHVVAIDPGVKTFATCYSPTMNMISKVGYHDYERMARLANAYSKIQSTAAKLKGEERKHRKAHLQRAQAKIYKKIQCLKHEVHYKLASWLTKAFDIIIVPPFNQGNCMTKKRESWTHKETRKSILHWSHCKFRNVLLYLAKERGKEVIILDESYTTKTCCGCGWLNDKVGNNDIFKCHNVLCNVGKLDRDANGAVNIFLKAVTLGLVSIDEPAPEDSNQDLKVLFDATFYKSN